MKRILLIGQPGSSSGFLRHTIAALQRRGCEVIVVNAHELFWPKLWPTLRGFSLDRDTWYRHRWENNLYSPSAWDRNTRLNGRLLDRVRRPGDLVLQMGKEYFPHPNYRELPFYVFVQSNLAIELKGGVAPWVPRPEDRPAFMEREGRLFRAARKVFTGALYVQDVLRKDYGVSAERLALGGGGADVYFTDHMPDPVPETLKKNMVFVGWDFGMKGGPTALEALQLARQHIPDLTLTLVGPDPAVVPDAPGLIKVGPARDVPRLAEYYRAADLFVLPSLYDTFGFVFVEAMSQGLPCIGTDFNAIPELIEEGVNGYRVPRQDARALADRIVQFYQQPALRARMGRAAQSRVRAGYTWDLVAERLLKGMTETL